MASPTRFTRFLALLLLLASSSVAVVSAQAENDNAAAVVDHPVVAAEEETVGSCADADRLIERIRTETASELAAKDAEIAAKVAEAELRIAREQADETQKVVAAKEEAHREDVSSVKAEMSARVASVTAKADADRTELLEATRREIEEAKAEAQRKLSLLEAEMSAKDEQHEKDISIAKADADAKVASVMSNVEKDRAALLAYGKKQMEDAEARHASELSEARALHARELRTAAKIAEGALDEKLATVRSKAEDELAAEQATCHTRVLEAENALAEATRSLEQDLEDSISRAAVEMSAERRRRGELEKKLVRKTAEWTESAEILNGDLESMRRDNVRLEKDVSSWKEIHESQGYCNITLISDDSKTLLANVWDVVDKEILPTVKSQTTEFYNAHLADTVNENLVPLYKEHIQPIYEQHILPAYTEHVSPVVEEIEGVASKEVERARAGAARLVRQSSSSALEAARERGFDDALPASLVSFLVRSSTDGEWAVDALSRGFLIILLILCCSMILRFVGGVFSAIWFFCPLRIVFGPRKANFDEIGGKKGMKNRYNMNGQMKKRNGKKA